MVITTTNRVVSFLAELGEEEFALCERVLVELYIQLRNPARTFDGFHSNM